MSLPELNKVVELTLTPELQAAQRPTSLNYEAQQCTLYTFAGPKPIWQHAAVSKWPIMHDLHSPSGKSAHSCFQDTMH